MNEHTQFKIDTSGLIDFGPHPEIELPAPFTYMRYVGFDDLSPFQQGAVEAALRELNARLFKSDGYTEADFFGFRHLSASALQRIMADCERFYAPYRARGVPEYGGGAFWTRRQANSLPDFPPLHLSLAEDGLIHLSEVG